MRMTFLVAHLSSPSEQLSPLWPCVDGRKFTRCFRENFLRKHLEDAALLQHVSLDGYRQPVFSKGFKQQQQQHAEGVGPAALAFGGLSFDECTAIFFAPNARPCRHPSLAPNISSFSTPPPVSQAPHFASQAATFSAAAASTTKFPLAHDAIPVAAATISTALRRTVKRPRDDCLGLGPHQLLRGGQAWLGVGSESALPDDVLLGFCCEGPAFTQCSAPPPTTQPLAPLPTSMPPLLTALSGCAPGSCITGTGAAQELEYLDACLNVLGDMISIDNNTADGNDNNTANGNDNNTANGNDNSTANGNDNNTANGNDNNTANGNDNNTADGNDNNTANGYDNYTADGNDRNGKDALYLDTPVADMLLGGRALTSSVHWEEWAVEQGGTSGRDAQPHQH
ncbi:unnamed protein product [Closterium sp. Yama58-4]|nr:unnamed protein product [Closterium sp. Yama58-4]